MNMRRRKPDSRLMHMVQNNNLVTLFLVFLFTAGLILPVCGANTCGPSKGLVSGQTLSSAYIAPVGTTLERPAAVDADQLAVKVTIDAEDFVSIGRTQLQSGKYQEALTVFDQAIAADPKNVVAWNGKMSALLYLERYEEVLDIFSDAIQEIPNDFGIWVNKGRAETYLNRYEDAEASIEKALTLNNESVDALNSKAYLLAINYKQLSGDYSGYYEILEITDKILELDADNKEIWWAKGTALEMTGKVDEAIEAYKKDITLKTGLTSECSYIRLYNIYEKEKPPAALELIEQINNEITPETRDNKLGYKMLKQLITRSPDIQFSDTIPAWKSYIFNPNLEREDGFLINRWEDLYTVLSEYIDDNDSINYDLVEDEQEIIVTTYKALNAGLINQANPQSVGERDKINEILIYLGIYLKIFEHHNEAIEAYEQALKLNPEFADAWNGKGVTLKELGRYEEAIIAYDTAISLGNEHAITLKEELLAERREGSASPSVGLFSGESLNTNTSSPYLKSQYSSPEEYIEAMETAFNDGDMDTLLELAIEALLIYPEDDEIWGIKGVALNNLGRFEKAIEAADTAIGLNRSNAHAWFVKGYALENLGKVLDAEIFYEKALSLSPDSEIYQEALAGVKT